MRPARMMICSALVLVLTAGSAFAQKGAPKPPACTDPSLEITVVPIDGSALGGDGKGLVYTNGVDGVYNTVIHLCGTSPTHDATFGLVTSKRSLTFTFHASLDDSTNSPAWADGTPFLAKPFVNIRDILWGRRNSQSTFTTRMSFGYLRGPGDRTDSYLRFMAPTTDALTASPAPADVNLPEATATVTVQDVPGTCRTTVGGTLDSWIVTIDPEFVGTLHKAGSGKNPDVHAGQYTMPFQLLIKAKTCLPW